MKIAELLTRLDPEVIEQIDEAEAAPTKIKRDTFLYMAPKEPKKKFAQCGTCRLFLPRKERCAILGPNLHVPAEASCGLYIHGKPSDRQKAESIVKPAEAGFVKRKVRCQNCVSFDNGTCKLFAMLNEAKPDIFDLDTQIDPQGCCNAQTPK
jgi:hypothetical protein